MRIAFVTEEILREQNSPGLSRTSLSVKVGSTSKNKSNTGNQKDFVIFFTENKKDIFYKSTKQQSQYKVLSK